MKTEKNLLSKTKIESILAMAKKNLTEYNHLQPVIFAKLDTTDKVALIPIEMPEDEHEKKALRFALYGEALRKSTGALIKEALFVSDTFYLATPKNMIPDTTGYIHDNPMRREAILITGRDITGSKHIMLLQPYTRIDKKIIFDKKPEFDDKAGSASGLLDYLFSAGEGKLADLTNDKAIGADLTNYHPDGLNNKYGKN